MGTVSDYRDETIRLRAAVYGLLSDALNEGVEGRNRQREPFLSPVYIQTEGDFGPKLVGFSRDVSAEGIGLLHAFSLEKENIVLRFPDPNRQNLQLQVKISWCKPFGDDWYISGGRFVARLDP